MRGARARDGVRDDAIESSSCLGSRCRSIDGVNRGTLEGAGEKVGKGWKRFENETRQHHFPPNTGEHTSPPL